MVMMLFLCVWIGCRKWSSLYQPRHTLLLKERHVILLSYMYGLYDLPKVILSDMDAKFTNRIMNALQGLLVTTLAMSIASHLQTDGKTKRINRAIGDMLRHFVKPSVG